MIGRLSFVTYNRIQAQGPMESRDANTHVFAELMAIDTAASGLAMNSWRDAFTTSFPPFKASSFALWHREMMEAQCLARRGAEPYNREIGDSTSFATETLNYFLELIRHSSSLWTGSGITFLYSLFCILQWHFSVPGTRCYCRLLWPSKKQGKQCCSDWRCIRAEPLP